MPQSEPRAGGGRLRLRGSVLPTRTTRGSLCRPPSSDACSVPYPKHSTRRPPWLRASQCLLLEGFPWGHFHPSALLQPPRCGVGGLRGGPWHVLSRDQPWPSTRSRLRRAPSGTHPRGRACSRRWRTSTRPRRTSSRCGAPGPAGKPSLWRWPPSAGKGQGTFS